MITIGRGRGTSSFQSRGGPRILFRRRFKARSAIADNLVSFVMPLVIVIILSLTYQGGRLKSILGGMSPRMCALRTKRRRGGIDCQ